ncbi:TetR/AcrR family transcriptional regulator [Modestobacter sp. SYSU DS0290]
MTGGASASRGTATVLHDTATEPADPVTGAEPAEDAARTGQVVAFAPPPLRETAALPAATGTAPAPADAGQPRRRRGRGGPSKRELRRQQTREEIVDAAAGLFAERGFDAVSVQQIAQRAGVVEKTVFNHFPVKEGLVFEADPPMREAVLDAVRHRRAGESAPAAAGRFVVAAISQLGSAAAADGVAEMARVIRGSRTLQVREREILGALTDSLAAEFAAETGAEPGRLEPWLAAHSVLGLYAALLELARDRVLAGAAGPELVAELQARGRSGLALLQTGLAGYAERPQQ